jgi:hypothetical protein
MSASNSGQSRAIFQHRKEFTSFGSIKLLLEQACSVPSESEKMELTTQEDIVHGTGFQHVQWGTTPWDTRRTFFKLHEVTTQKPILFMVWTCFAAVFTIKYTKFTFAAHCRRVSISTGFTRNWVRWSSYLVLGAGVSGLAAGAADVPVTSAYISIEWKTWTQQCSVSLDCYFVAHFSNPMMEATWYSETPVKFCRSTPFKIP